ncbi:MULTISPECIES: helix-turn-helix transcriptional regulator [Acetobacter]|uniref:XRE family transcriptional regulator n=1 Tax=Acetobacter tropicalis TaxID=104102 RepID=A0A291PD61_9PROT|nr:MULTISPECIES: helix-turn-helix transcriptional regulator [Acetobacter]ATJ89393.1 XRE family transcriptional regulator [Acetobacter tropicalis]
MITQAQFDHIMAERIGALIKRERKRSGLAQDELARRSGYSRVTVKKTEDGRTLPRLPVLFALLWELDCTQSVWDEISRIDACLRAQMKREAA